MKIKDSYFITMILSLSAGCLTGLAIWGKPPMGGDELGAYRFAVLGVFLIAGHVLYNSVLRKHFFLD